jgi:sarcosine/dimethylglycine N-methyltransferase
VNRGCPRATLAQTNEFLPNYSQENFAAQTALRRQIEVEGPPPLGMHVLIGDRLRQQRLNSYNALRDGRARMVEIVARKPS